MSEGSNSEEKIQPVAEAKEVKKTPNDKMTEHRERMIRTGVACFMGIATGVISYLVIGDPTTPAGEPRSILGLLLLLAGIVFQKHVFMALRIDYSKLGGKDWFYQSFMAFAFWFISWTILLTL
ncbi:hypothetical protein L1994_07170 [Methanomicrobium antiquum]|uniref:Uncharacterized protein n=1 Tax=Methanomicrobium antiquum TaxID=487686 RepID=A0AAF0JLA9_9EURY|nr:hypothetical protein [Methanomicrobium antiquum]MDD3976703.1 hypothetical protein [Methanomicrobium sp.]WFN35937.1 hypothetical protein L1994_07170 [Methanomicrobium antiquum]